MALETVTPASRRALLAAGLGGLAAMVAGALGRPAPTRADDGAPVLQGVFNTSQSTTTVAINSNTSNHALVGAANNSGTGVWGSSPAGNGVHGSSTSHVGVYGESTAGTGVYALSSGGVAIHAISASAAVPAMLSRSTGSSTGVHGVSGSGNFPVAPAKTGVHGYAVQDANARGVTGQTTAGRGINGIATTGVGGYFTATTGTALRAEGAVRFKTSGLATIAMGSRSVTVTPAGLDVTTSSKILALLQGDAGGSTVVQRVAVNATANTFTIYLTANSVRAVKVSWFVIS
jgi:hypothetical protein